MSVGVREDWVVCFNLFIRWFIYLAYRFWDSEFVVVKGQAYGRFQVYFVIYRDIEGFGVVVVVFQGLE